MASALKINIYFKDVTDLIWLQQTKSDKRYQDAIEANYSHEQMTPLNNILSNAKMLLTQIKNTMKKGDEKSSRMHYKELRDS